MATASIEIGRDDLPALYRAYGSTSAAAQAEYLKSQRTVLWVLVAIAVASGAGQLAPAFAPVDHRKYEVAVAVVSGLLFAVSLWFTERQESQRKQENWYDARALAESTKSMAWKFMMRADPYRRDNADRLFASDLRKLLSDARHQPPMADDGDQITARMRDTRALETSERLAIYRRERIANQRAWYKARSRQHDASHTRWHRAVTMMLVIALALSVLAVVEPAVGAAVGIATTLAPCAIAWNQTKRNRELAHSYAFTSHEIGLLDAGVQPTDDDQMARFVADCETAFSREHTMWRARREITEG